MDDSSRVYAGEGKSATRLDLLLRQGGAEDIEEKQNHYGSGLD